MGDVRITDFLEFAKKYRHKFRQIAKASKCELARSYGEFRAVAGVGAIRNEADYDRALALIEAILDETRDTPAREDATLPLADLLDLLTAAVHEYEADHYAMPASSPSATD